VAVALLTQFLLTDLKGTVPKPAYGFAIAVALFGASAFARRRSAVPGAPAGEAPVAEPAAQPTLPIRLEIALFAGILLLAVFFRFWRFLEFPPGLWYDEAVNGTDAFSIIDRDHLTVWRSSNFGHSTIFFYLLIASFKTFGYTVFAMRLVPAVAGLAAVFGFYFLARWLTGPIPALVATALLAVSRWAVTFSRISWEASLQPLFEIMAVYFFVRALEKRTNYLYYFLAGGSLAAGIYTYLAFRFVPVVLLFFLAYIAVTKWRLLWENRIGLVVYALSFLVVIAPLGQFALRNQDLVLARTRDINVFTEIEDRGSYAPLRHNIRTSIEMMNVQGDLNGRHNLPGAPMLDEITGALLVLGFAAAAWSFRDWRKGSMAGWYVLALLPGALTISIENPSAIRGIGAIPPLFLLVALAVATLQRSLGPSRQGVAAFCAIAGLLVAGSVAINYYDLFERQAKNLAVYEGFSPEFTQVGEIIAANAADKHVIVSRQFAGHEAVAVLGRGKEFDHYEVPEHLILPPSSQDTLMVLDAMQFQMLPALRTLYPNLVQDDYVDPFDRVFFTRVTIPAQDTVGLHAVPAVWSVAGSTAPPPSPSPARLDREWTQEDLRDGPIVATWEGYLWVPAYPHDAVFTMTVPGGTGSIEIDGQPFTPDTAGNLPRQPLTVGEHRLKVTALVSAPGSVGVKAQPELGDAYLLQDAIYGASMGTGGYQVIYRSGPDFSADVLTVGRVPFTVGVPALPDAPSIEYRGEFTVPGDGVYGFSLNGTSSAQLFIDDDLIVDNGGGHPLRLVESETVLTAGTHTLSVQYSGALEPNWVAAYKEPGGEYVEVDASFVKPPSVSYRPPALVKLAADPAWGAARAIPDMAHPSGVAVLPDGTIAVGGDDAIAIFDSSGDVVRTFKIDGFGAIVDLAVTGRGDLAVLDGETHVLGIVRPADGSVSGRVEGQFLSSQGLDAVGDRVYVASPNGGYLYVVSLPDGTVEGLPLALPEAPVRAVQPSDIAVGEDGTIYVSDFEKKVVLRSPDGVNATTFRGAGGTGGQLPHLAFSAKLVFLSDPINERVLVYDAAGKQRGTYIFPVQRPATRAIGIAATADGLVYVVDANGFLYRLQVEIPPETQAELDALPASAQ
jgi:4-amino-4-deoxy-L-arabinose transferase-like glycosyltransferase